MLAAGEAVAHGQVNVKVVAPGFAGLNVLRLLSSALSKSVKPPTLTLRVKLGKSVAALPPLKYTTLTLKSLPLDISSLMINCSNCHQPRRPATATADVTQQPQHHQNRLQWLKL